jgi:streptogramin lyase
MAMAAMALVSASPGAAQLKPIDLPGERLHPESISISADGMAYVSSATGGVLRVSLASGEIVQWIRPGDFGSGSTFGVLVDAGNGLLWVCNNDLGAQGIVIPGADKGSTLKAIDLRSGEGRLSFTLPGSKSPVCNDMAIAGDGTLYVAETANSHILRLTPGATALEDWSHDPVLAAPDGFGLDGIALGGDGHLYVNNIRTGKLIRVERKADGTAGKSTVLESSRAFESPDGLRPLGGLRFIQAEGGGKIGIVTIAGDRATVETLAQGFSAPTGVDSHDGTAWLVQGEFGYIFNPQLRGKTPPRATLTPVKLPAPVHSHH